MILRSKNAWVLGRPGAKFDSSKDRDAPFGFKIGSGVITGWSEVTIFIKNR